jgi:hypothetical protein
MGTCVLKTERKEFEPITFEVTVENEEELKWLWHAFNLSNHGLQINPEESGLEMPDGNVVESLHFWLPVNDVVEKLGLINEDDM